MKKKKSMKEQKYFRQHDKILEINIPYGFNATNSPHVVLHKWYHIFKDNCILLKLNGESFEGKNRQIFYKIQKIGDNVKFTKKG